MSNYNSKNSDKLETSNKFNLENYDTGVPRSFSVLEPPFGGAKRTQTYDDDTGDLRSFSVSSDEVPFGGAERTQTYDNDTYDNDTYDYKYDYKYNYTYDYGGVERSGTYPNKYDNMYDKNKSLISRLGVWVQGSDTLKLIGTPRMQTTNISLANLV